MKVKPEELEPKKVRKQVANLNTNLGDGKIEYVLARVDTRLLHGQVATSWTKATRPDRIIVVSDAVSKDALRKTMITEAAPPGVKANTVPIDKMVEVDKDPRFGNTKALLLFETPQDALKAIEKGMKIDELNIGSMAHSVGKVAVTTSLAMDMEDVKTFEKLLGLGVKMDVRKVPADTPGNIEQILNKVREKF
ncbi:PTS system mannose/fructose/N-acetylgalactosamine-transporter subunit IIB [Streptobacillus moniliformis]|uniref:PTS system mannose/fructose/N-acetylgalactosamine-transporter subunit IIB n=1 Tax=Streptobacillus moniliformis TaxID=34105 RepID=UPI002D21D6E4|nr:PTS system mannose/fructose/N-acetylgalactosamine-transporter subunit IIB [Streptobacillus moniliformis]